MVLALKLWSLETVEIVDLSSSPFAFGYSGGKILRTGVSRVLVYVPMPTRLYAHLLDH
jgi:hypothetical protein